MRFLIFCGILLSFSSSLSLQSIHRADMLKLYEVYSQRTFKSINNPYPNCGVSIPDDIGGRGYSFLFPVGRSTEFFVNDESNIQYFKLLNSSLSRIWSASLLEGIDDKNLIKGLGIRSIHTRATDSTFLKYLSNGKPTLSIGNECGILPNYIGSLEQFSFGHFSSRILPSGKEVCSIRTGNYMNYDSFGETFEERLSCP